MSFTLFGFDFIKRDGIFGLWIASLKNWEDMERSLLCLHYSEGEWRVEIFWYRVI